MPVPRITVVMALSDGSVNLYEEMEGGKICLLPLLHDAGVCGGTPPSAKFISPTLALRTITVRTPYI